MKMGLSTITGILLILLAGCCGTMSPPSSPIPSGDIEKLLVDILEFPSGWRVELPPYPADEKIGQIDGRWTQFRCESSFRLASHDIYLYDDKEGAGVWYDLQLDSVFGSAQRLTPWEAPVGMPYPSSAADQFRFACAEFEDFQSVRYTRCKAMGQYDRFLVIFSTPISEDCMTFGELESILLIIDTRMSSHILNK